MAKVKPKGCGTARKDLAAFCAFWTRATSPAEVVAHFGGKYKNISVLASKLRKQGVALKRFPRFGGRGPGRPKAQPLDVAALNDAIAKAAL